MTVQVGQHIRTISDEGEDILSLVVAVNGTKVTIRPKLAKNSHGTYFSLKDDSVTITLK